MGDTVINILENSFPHQAVILQTIIQYNHHTNSLDISTVESVGNFQMESWLGPNNLRSVNLVPPRTIHITD